MMGRMGFMDFSALYCCSMKSLEQISETNCKRLPNALATHRVLAVKETELLKILSELITPRHCNYVDLNTRDKRFGSNRTQRNE